MDDELGNFNLRVAMKVDYNGQSHQLSSINQPVFSDDFEETLADSIDRLRLAVIELTRGRDAS